MNQIYGSNTKKNIYKTLHMNNFLKKLYLEKNFKSEMSF